MRRLLLVKVGRWRFGRKGSTVERRLARLRQAGRTHSKGYGRPKVNNAEPAATAMYCFPFTAKAIGDE